MSLTRKLNTDITIIIIVIASLIAGSWSYLQYTQRDLEYKYKGILYNTEDSNIEDQISIEVKGKYSIGLFGKMDMFEGKILVGDSLLDYSETPLVINKRGMASLENCGPIFVDELFKSLVIIAENENNQIRGLRGKSYWVVSAPCSSRKEAVQIYDKLHYKMSKR